LVIEIAIFFLTLVAGIIADADCIVDFRLNGEVTNESLSRDSEKEGCFQYAMESRMRLF
jgi:hypothetical protein